MRQFTQDTAMKTKPVLNIGDADRKDTMDEETVIHHDRLFKKALKVLLERKDYHIAPPIEKHKMLMKELDTLYWKERDNGRPD